MSNPYESPARDDREVERRIEAALENRELKQRLEALEKSQRRWKWIIVVLFVVSISYTFVYGALAEQIRMELHREIGEVNYELRQDLGLPW